MGLRMLRWRCWIRGVNFGEKLGLMFQFDTYSALFLLSYIYDVRERNSAYLASGKLFLQVSTVD
jgi:hypothetical protein